MKRVFTFFFVLIVVFFYPYWTTGKIPMPGDHMLGIYHPWIDYTWPGFPAGVPVKNPLLADVPSLFYPLKLYSVHLFGSGIFPSWNPLIFNGYPLLANFQSGVLNPFNFFFLFFEDTMAWTFFIAVQPFLALTFMYFFLRQLGLSKLSSVVGSVIYAFCGFNMIWLEYGIHGFVASYIPLLFLLISLFASTGKIKYALYFSITIALQLFSGYPQISLYSIIFVSLWHFIVVPGLKNKAAHIIKYVTFVTLGLGLSGMLLLPGIELFKNSQRVGEALAGGKSGAYLQWGQLITLIAPDFFGHPATYNSWGDYQYTNNTGYASIVAVILGIIALCISKRKIRWYFVFLYLFPLVLSLPTPVSTLVQNLPLFSASVITRILVFSAFSISVLAAVGMHELLSRRQFSLRGIRWFVLPGLALSVIALGTLISLGILHQTSPASSSMPFLTIINQFSDDHITSLRNLVFPFLIFLGVLVTLVVWRYHPLKKHFLAALVICFSVVELFRFGWKYNPFFDKKLIFPSTPVISYLSENASGFRVDGGDVLPLSLWMAYGLQSSSGYDAVYPRYWSEYLSAIDHGDIGKPKGRLGDYFSYSSPLIDISGVKYILGLKRDSSGTPAASGEAYPRFRLDKLSPVYSDRSVQVFANTKALPKYSLISGYEVLESDSAVIQRLQQDDFDYHNTLILQENPQIRFSRSDSDSGLEIIRDYPASQKFLVTTSSPVFLLNTQNYYPGWEATIDDTKTIIYRSDYSFQSVLIPPGVHLVEFTYRPLSITIGACITFISFTIIIGLLTALRSRDS